MKIGAAITAKGFSFVMCYSFPTHLMFSARFSFGIIIGRSFSATKKLFNKILFVYVYPNYDQQNRNVTTAIII